MYRPDLKTDELRKEDGDRKRVEALSLESTTVGRKDMKNLTVVLVLGVDPIDKSKWTRWR